MVRLKEMLEQLTTIAVSEFQFHYGSIKSPAVCCISVCPRYFNSTMVRLKAYEGKYVSYDIDKFQFHYGSIKSPVKHRPPKVFFISIPLWFD